MTSAPPPPLNFHPTREEAIDIIAQGINLPTFRVKEPEVPQVDLMVEMVAKFVQSVQSAQRIFIP